ncbi:MAG: ThuA domain-containing protein [Clostridia bacterium]|nr:ThuA domain-containing protein [Clostridia bacterium]
MIRVTIYNEFVHERTHENVREVYPDGIHMTLSRALQCEDIEVKTVTLLDDQCGLTDETLKNTDVLIWWGHMAHGEVPDEVAQRVRDHVQMGMGAIFLHSAHESKPFKLLMGTPCSLTWREDGDFERVWVVNPAHPIAQGIGRFIYLPHEETYGEPFTVPEPLETVFIGGYEGGEVFRSGMTYVRGNGKIFYFQPGHETNPTFKIPEIQRVIKNAVYWANPIYRTTALGCPHVEKP